MDSGVDTTQRIVIGVAIFLGIAIVFAIGYSLYTKAKNAEGELANKVALDAQTKQSTAQANVSLTGEAKNTNGVTYDGLIQKKDNSPATSTNFGIVDETASITVPDEQPAPQEDPVPPEENTPVEPVVKPVVKKPVVIDDDQPLTEAEIQAIRQLPIDNSPSGNLQTSLEEESNGQYKARY